MKEENYGQEAAQDAQREDRPQEPEAQPVVADVDASAYKAQIAERDGRIAELEAQVAEAAKTAEATEALSSDFFSLAPSDVVMTFSGCSNHVAAFKGEVAVMSSIIPVPNHFGRFDDRIGILPVVGELGFASWDDSLIGGRDTMKAAQATDKDNRTNWITKRFGGFDLEAKLGAKVSDVRDASEVIQMAEQLAAVREFDVYVVLLASDERAGVHGVLSRETLLTILIQC